MNTHELVTTFLERCKAKGLSENTLTGYSSYLSRFAQDNPMLPTDPTIIENWLITRGESFTRRGNTLKRLQAFYEDLVQHNILPGNPIPPGKAGRPKITEQPIIKATQETTPPRVTASTMPQVNTLTLINEYITSCKARGLTDNTVKEYEEQLTKFADLHPTLPYELPEIEKFWAGYTQEHDEWKHGLFRIVRAFYYWAADVKGLPTQLKFKRIAPKRTLKYPDNLSEEKAAELLALLPTMPPQDRAIIELLIEAGPRVSELCSIVKEHISEDEVIVKGKTGERAIEISPYIRDSLRNLIPGNSGPIFWSKTGKPLSTEKVYRLVQHYLAQIGITSGKRGPHMLRHSMGRLYMASEKGDIESLRQQMGHINIQTTAIYARLSRKQVHKKFDGANPRERVMEILHNGEAKQEKLL